MKRNLVGIVALLSLCSSALAVPSIVVGNHVLLPETANQQIAISVTGGDLVQGVNLLTQVGDGGSALGGVNGSAPKVQDISITNGTIFQGNNNGRVFDDPPTDQFWQIHTTTASGSVSASGTLAIITFDTTGFSTGTYPLLLGDIGGDSNTDTDFAGVSANIVNGSIIVPEPATFILLPLILLRRRQVRSSQRANSSP